MKAVAPGLKETVTIVIDVTGMDEEDKVSVFRDARDYAEQVQGDYNTGAATTERESNGGE